MKDSVRIGMQLEVGGVVMKIPVVDPQYKDTELVVSPDTHFAIDSDSKSLLTCGRSVVLPKCLICFRAYVYGHLCIVGLPPSNIGWVSYCN